MTIDKCEIRCHDMECPERNDCERYIQRHTGKIWLKSMFPKCILLTDPCPWKIQKGSEDE